MAKTMSKTILRSEECVLKKSPVLLLTEERPTEQCADCVGILPITGSQLAHKCLPRRDMDVQGPRRVTQILLYVASIRSAGKSGRAADAVGNRDYRDLPGVASARAACATACRGA